MDSKIRIFISFDSPMNVCYQGGTLYELVSETKVGTTQPKSRPVRFVE